MLDDDDRNERIRLGPRLNVGYIHFEILAFCTDHRLGSHIENASAKNRGL